MVLTFTGSISVAEAGRAEETRAVLIAAVTGNVAWGIVDAAMYLMTTFAERARGVAALRTLRAAAVDDTAAGLLRDALPPEISAVVTPAEIQTLRDRLRGQPQPTPRLDAADFKAALGVF